MTLTNCANPESIPHALITCLRTAEPVTVLTGAGVSAESGIPTFREPHTGLWARYDPAELASPEAFERAPATVWDWYQWRRELIGQSRPNPGHRALAELEQYLEDMTVVTQNVDGFHTLAGSRRVLELHGNIQRTICSRTRRVIDEDWLDRHHDRRPPPSPHDSQGLARPDVVWFGETLNAEVLDAAFAAAERCGVMIAAGTSGTVQPAASLPAIAVRSGAVLIDINPQENELTRLAHWHLAGSSAEWLPALARALDSPAD